jgi:putative SOS response-associated peptidase YedK
VIKLCNLYSITNGQQAIRALSGAMQDRTGNLPPFPGIFPDYSAPIVRNQPDGRELTMARWGLPSPVYALKGRNPDSGVTNVRNVSSPHWRRWLGIGNRCVVPLPSFAENEILPNGTRPPVWFALDATRPLAFFAGICGPKGQGRRDNQQSLCVLDDRPEQDRRVDSSESHARHSNESARDRHLDDRADQ